MKYDFVAPLKTQSNRLWKLPQKYKSANPGHKNLRKIYTRLPNAHTIWNLVTKTFKLILKSLPTWYPRLMMTTPLKHIITKKIIRRWHHFSENMVSDLSPVDIYVKLELKHKFQNHAIYLINHALNFKLR